jgi:hypothetical protein
MPTKSNLRLLPMAALLMPFSATSAQKQSDIPLRITLHETAVVMDLNGNATGSAPQSAIIGDGNDVYTDGQTTGVTIKFSSGTYDAVLNLLVGKRKITAVVPSPVYNPQNGLTPTLGSYTAAGLLSIRNMICHGCTSGTFGVGKPYVTQASLGLGPIFNGDDYVFLYLPITNLSGFPLAPDLDVPQYGSLANSPKLTSLVMVFPQSYNCSQEVYPSWLVRGSILNEPSAGLPGVAAIIDKTVGAAAGQASMPFEMLVEALQCFNPGY